MKIGGAWQLKAENLVEYFMLFGMFVYTCIFVWFGPAYLSEIKFKHYNWHV